MNKIKAILEVIWMFLVPFVIANGTFYLLGSFIAMDWNPINWWLLTSTWGRVITVFIEIAVIAQIPKFWED